MNKYTYYKVVIQEDYKEKWKINERDDEYEDKK